MYLNFCRIKSFEYLNEDNGATQFLAESLKQIEEALRNGGKKEGLRKLFKFGLCSPHFDYVCT